MDEKTLQALTALATKLGVTAEYLWGVMVKQAPISGALDLAVIAAWTAACVWLVRRKTAGDPPEWRDDMARAMAWVAVGLVCVLTAVIGGFEFTGAVTAIVNPEY